VTLKNKTGLMRRFLWSHVARCATSDDVLRMPLMEPGYARDLISKDRREYRRQREAEPRVAECLCPGEKLELMRRLGITPTAPLRSCCEALGKMIDEMAFVITGDPEYLRQGPKIVQGYEPLK